MHQMVALAQKRYADDVIAEDDQEQELQKNLFNLTQIIEEERLRDLSFHRVAWLPVSPTNALKELSAFAHLQLDND